MDCPHKHDEQWVKDMMAKIPYGLQSKARQGYRSAFEQAWNAESVEHRKSNAARREANTRLRLYV